MDTIDKTQPKRSIYCDDCGMEKMAEIHKDKLVIRKKTRGQLHFAVVNVTGKQGGK